MDEPLTSAAALPQVACPQCHTPLPCHDPARSRYFGCHKCRTFFAATPLATTRPAQRLDGFKRALVPGPALPLGAVGTLAGHRCRLTGYQVRGERQDKTAEWREYQLRPAGADDDDANFPLQLAEYQGHWLLIRYAPTHPAILGARPFAARRWHDEATGRGYKLWHRYQPLIRDALGEFDWNILDDEELKIQEFIAPPYQLSSEQAPGEEPTWYLAEYLEPEYVSQAFGLTVSDLPGRFGIGAAQLPPSPNWPRLRRLAVWGGLALLAGQLALLALRGPEQVLNQSFALKAPAPAAVPTPTTPPAANPSPPAAAAPAPTPPVPAPSAATTASALPPLSSEAAAAVSAAEAARLGNGGSSGSEGGGGSSGNSSSSTSSSGGEQTLHMLTTESFSLDHSSALEVSLHVPNLDNHWAEVTASLVNEQTGQGYEFTRSIEYYHGVESGESWTEGGTDASAVLSHVPAGRYHLNLYPTLDAGTGSGNLIAIVETSTTLWSNFWLALLGLLALPVAVGWRQYNFESERWQQSEFNPYPTPDESE